MSENSNQQLRLRIMNVKTKQNDIDGSYPLTSILGEIYPNARFACGGKVVSGATTLEDLHKLAPTKEIIDIIGIPSAPPSVAAPPPQPSVAAPPPPPSAAAPPPPVASEPSTITIIIDKGETQTELDIEPTHSVGEHCSNGSRIIHGGQFKIYNESRPLTVEDIIIDIYGKKYDKTRTYTFKIIDPVGSKEPTMQEQLANRRRRQQTKHAQYQVSCPLGSSPSMSQLQEQRDCIMQLGSKFGLQFVSATCTVSCGGESIELDAEYCARINYELVQYMNENFENDTPITAFQYQKKAFSLLQTIGGIEHPPLHLLLVLSEYGKHSYNIIKYFLEYSELLQNPPLEYGQQHIQYMADIMNAIPSTRYKLAMLELFPPELSEIFQQTCSVTGKRLHQSSNIFVPQQVIDEEPIFDSENEKFDPKFWNKFYCEKFKK